MSKFLSIATLLALILISFYLYYENIGSVTAVLSEHFYVTSKSNLLVVTTFSVITFLILIFIIDTSMIKKIFFLLYSVSGILITLSSSLIVLIMFYELMAIFGIVIVALSCTNKEILIRYSLAHLLSGIILVIGICLETSNSLQFSHTIISLDSISNTISTETSKCLIFLALLINCAAFPFSGWLIESYSKISSYGTLILSTFTTKVSLFILLKLFYGSSILIIIGFSGIIYAVIAAIFENHIKRLACYNLLGQISSIIMGIGINSPIIQDTISLHIIFSLLYNCLFFMSVTEMITRTGKYYFQDIGSLLVKMPIESLSCLTAVLATLPFPLIGTFISKSLVKFALADSVNANILINQLFFISSPLLFIVSGLKLFWWPCITNAKKSLRIKKGSLAKKSIMLILCILCISSAVFYKLYIHIFLNDSSRFNPYSKFDLIINSLFLVIALLLVTYSNKHNNQKNTYNAIDFLYKISMQPIILFIVNSILYINTIIKIGSHKLLKIAVLENNINKIFDHNSIRITVLFLMMFMGILLCLNL